MSYTPPLGNAVGLAFTVAYPIPSGETLNLEFDPTYTANLRAAGGIPAPIFKQVGFIVNNQRQNVFLSGLAPPSMTPIALIERVSQKVYPTGIDSAGYATQHLIYNQPLAAIGGIEPPEMALPITKVRLAGGYQGAPATSVILDFRTEAYSPPPATSVILEFGSTGFTFVLGAGVGDSSAFGGSTLTKQLAVSGITLGDTSGFGTNTVQNTGGSINTVGIAPITFPTNHTVEKVIKVVNPTGIAVPTFPTTHKIENKTTSVKPTGIAPIAVPTTHRVSNRNQNITTVGIAPPAFPVTNSVSYSSTDWDVFNYSMMLF